MKYLNPILRVIDFFIYASMNIGGFYKFYWQHDLTGGAILWGAAAIYCLSMVAGDLLDKN